VEILVTVGQHIVDGRRGFTIRLTRLKPRAPDFGGPKRLGVRTISSIPISIIFVLVERTFFCYAANKRSL